MIRANARRFLDTDSEGRTLRERSLGARRLARAVAQGAAVVLALPAVAPDWDLTRVSGVVLRPDGRLVTLSPVGNRFFRFGPDGHGERVLARQEAGPGELMAPSGPVAAAGDRVVVIDPANNRINWFAVMKGGVRTAALPRQPAVHRMDIVGVLRSGAFVGTSRIVGDHVADRVTR